MGSQWQGYMCQYRHISFTKSGILDREAGWLFSNILYN